MTEPSSEKLYYTPSEAVEYLRNERGIIYAVTSLRNLRRRKKATASHKLINNTLWTKAELDAIRPSSRTKRVETEGDSEGGRGESSSMILRKFGYYNSSSALAVV